MNPTRFVPLLIAILFCAASIVSGPVLAGEVPQAALTGDTELLLADGWEETAPGIYQRFVGDTQETLAYGDAGPRLELGWLDSRIAMLTESFELGGSAEVAQALQDLEMRRDELIEAAALRETTSQEVGSLDSLALDAATVTQGSCTAQIDVTSEARAGYSGPRASATSGFSDSCGRSAQIRCYTSSRGYLNGAFVNTVQADGPRTIYGSGTCSTTAEIAGDTNCFADSRAQVDFLDAAGQPATYFEVASISECVPFAVAMGNAPASMTVPAGECKTQRVTAQSNRSGTSFQWSHNNGSPVGGSFFDLQYCNYSSSSYTVTNTLTLTGTANSLTADDTATYDVSYEPTGVGDLPTYDDTDQ